MGAFLIDNNPARHQFAPRTRWAKSDITGCTVLHTAEGVMDTVGMDTGAENVARFIQGRADPGSYHDLVDSDSGIWMVPYHLGAYHDGTGSNGFATSISFACRTSDWRKMSPAKRRGFLYQGALRFKAQQEWRLAHGHPLTALRYITKADSDRGESGFTCHGWRDPSRRTDPGIESPNLFPFDEWLDVCREVMAGAIEEDDDMPHSISIHVKPGTRELINFPPVQGGDLVKWGKGVVSFVTDSFGDSNFPDGGVEVRVYILGSRGFRRLNPEHTTVRFKQAYRYNYNLRDGDCGMVITALDKNFGVGVCVEIDKA